MVQNHVPYKCISLIPKLFPVMKCWGLGMRPLQPAALLLTLLREATSPCPSHFGTETLFSLGEEELGVCLEEGGADNSSVSPGGHHTQAPFVCLNNEPVNLLPRLLNQFHSSCLNIVAV